MKFLTPAENVKILADIRVRRKSISYLSYVCSAVSDPKLLNLTRNQETYAT
jgi:hypothetical protein